jgi:flagellar FliJ protein
MKPFSLQPILELMQNRADDATRRLATLIASEKDAKNKLAMLQEYRDEYASRFRQAAQNGIAQREYHNYQEFLCRLDEAIDQQGKTVGLQERNTMAGQTHWQQQRVKLKAFDTLSQRHKASELELEVRREQKIQDEFASRKKADQD